MTDGPAGRGRCTKGAECSLCRGLELTLCRLLLAGVSGRLGGSEGAAAPADESDEDETTVDAAIRRSSTGESNRRQSSDDASHESTAARMVSITDRAAGMGGWNEVTRSSLYSNYS